MQQSKDGNFYRRRLKKTEKRRTIILVLNTCAILLYTIIFCELYDLSCLRYNIDGKNHENYHQTWDEGEDGGQSTTLNKIKENFVDNKRKAPIPSMVNSSYKFLLFRKKKFSKSKTLNSKTKIIKSINFGLTLRMCISMDLFPYWRKRWRRWHSIWGTLGSIGSFSEHNENAHPRKLLQIQMLR